MLRPDEEAAKGDVTGQCRHDHDGPCAEHYRDWVVIFAERLEEARGKGTTLYHALEAWVEDAHEAWRKVSDIERQLSEARGKLEALREDAKKVKAAGPSKDDQWWVDRILRGEEKA